MSGRFANPESIPLQAGRFKAVVAPGTEAWRPTWNAAPTLRHPVVIQDHSSRRIGLMTWGWKPLTLNGRMLVDLPADEAISTRTFQPAVERHRCLVPATAFYEWQEREPGPAAPFAVARRDRRPFGIAGLWESAGDRDHHVGIFVLLTVPANPLLAPIHHHMAAILHPEDEDRWLDPANDGQRAIGLLQPPAVETVAAWPVSMAVESVENDGPQLLDPAIGLLE